MPTHQSLQRAVAILREFSESNPALTVSEVSRRLDLHKSTVSRILATLLEEGLVWHNAETGRYSLGMGLVEMAGVALGQIDVRAAAMPHMADLVAEVDETVAVVARRDRDGITVAHLPSSHSIRHVVWIGRRMPLASTAAGKTLLAAMHLRGEDWRAAAGMSRTERPAKWEHVLAASLEAIGAQGYADEADEFEVGTSAIAAPIRDSSGTTIAALTISGPTGRFSEDIRRETAPRLIDAANAVAADLGMRRHAVLEGGPV